jgi:homoserine O-acetyltransferase/O-succinyltransferase
MVFTSFGRAALVAILALVAAPVWAQGGSVGIVEKKVFTMPSYTTTGGATLTDVKVGWEAYGTLNAARDNVIIVPHFYTGNSHAAGRYKAEDPVPGYWEPIIGPGKPIDTDKFYVVSVDSLVNLNTKDPNTTTTGPATLNPATGKPWGMSFPIVTFRDFVNVQKALLDSLGVRKLHAAIGASMGALQSIEWAAAYPDFVERLIPVIGIAEIDAYSIERINLWASAVTLDPNWNNGDYYGKTEPTAGLAFALKMVTLDTRHQGWAEKTFGRKWAAADRDPAKSWENKYLFEDTLDKAGAARARSADANSFLYLAKANQLFVAGHAANLEEGLAKIKAKSLFIPAQSDLLLVPGYARRAVDILRKQGKSAELIVIEGDGGHLDGVFAVAKVGEDIRKFLQQ